jgi:hypothetical protein
MEQATMRYAEEAEGPFTVVLRDGLRLKLVYLDGGGMAIGEVDELTGAAPVYEVHGEYLDGGFAVIPQEQIARVLDVRGEEVEFGNPYRPGHPRPREL